jgi:hypothetical protein
MHHVLVAVVLTALSCLQDRPATPKLSVLKEPAEFLGEGWTGPRGLVIDDVKDLSSLSDAEKTVATEVAQAMIPLGITAVADFTYKKNLETVTLRILVFETAAAAEDFWKKKIEVDGWESLYRKADVPGARAVDSLVIRKRIVLAGNVYLACHMAPAAKTHLTVLNKYLEKLRAASK